MVTRQIDLARRHHEMAVDQINDAVRQIGRKVRTVITAAIFPQPASDVHPRKAFAQRELHIRVSLVVAQQNVEARLLLLDQVVFKRQRLFVIGDHDVINVHGLAYQGVGFSILPSPFAEIRRHAAAQVVGFADIDNFAFGVLVEVNAGRSRETADFCLEIHLTDLG